MRVQKTILVRPMCLTNYTLSYIRFPRGWKRSLFTLYSAVELAG